MARQMLLTAIFFIVVETLAAPSAAAGGDYDALTSERWVSVKTEGCRSEAERHSQELDRLRTDLPSTALSREELRFAEKEAADYTKALNKERSIRLRDLEFLLFRQQAKKLEKIYLARASGGSRSERASLKRSVGLFAAGVVPCQLRAMETTLLLSVFSMPLDNKYSGTDASPWQVLQGVEAEYARQAADGKTVEETFLALRPQEWEPTVRLIEAMLDSTINDSPSAGMFSAAERRQLSSSLDEFLHLSAEPLRIEVAVHVLVGDFERAIGISTPERLMDGLQKQLDQQLFANSRMLLALREASPGESLQRAYSIVDNWLQEAWPVFQSNLYNDPVTAYSLFIQTGVVPNRPAPFKGARLRVEGGTPELRELRQSSVREFCSAMGRSRVPASFPQKYAAVENAMSSVVLSRAEFLRRAEARGMTAADGQSLVRSVPELSKGTDELSSLDLLTPFIEDASRLQIRRNRHVWAEGLRVFEEAKREALQREIDALPQGPDRDRLAAYLRTAGEWMLELEQRQATEKSFQLLSGGGPIGWTLRRTVISNGLPQALWVPNGVAGPEFARMIDRVVPNGCPLTACGETGGSRSLEFLESGQRYYQSLLKVLDEAQDFLNIEQYDWKLDRGGKEIAYRVMSKKLGLDREHYDSLVQEFREGLPKERGKQEKVLFYDLPTKWMKNLLFYKLFASSEQEPMKSLRSRLEQATGDRIRCPNLADCGDLSKLYAKSGGRFDHKRQNDPGYLEAWEIYRDLEGLFAPATPALEQTRPRRSLAGYVRKHGDVQRFVDRYGLKRADQPERPFDVNVITEGKRDSWNWIVKTGRLQNPLMEFNVRYLPWKGAIEYPWHVGRLPLSGRWFAKVVPMPYVPWPWLQAVPAFGWTGIPLSMVGQHFLATDLRNAWGVASHTKHVGSESAALESGMGFGTKYFNVYNRFQTWRDIGVVVRGPVVDDGNQVFVSWFNRARHNNRGQPEARGVKIPRLKSEDYSYAGPDGISARTWFLSTDPDANDYNYRGVFLSAVAAAQENIYIENVFYSDPAISRMLILKAREFRARVTCEGLTDLVCAAKKRDAVNIYLILPLATDQPLVDLAGRADYYQMINEGVKLYLWQPNQGYATRHMMHTKAWQVDYRDGEAALTYVGSHNANRRSLWSDNEMGIASTSPEFAREVHEKLFLHDIRQDASRVTAASFDLERRIRPKRRVGRFIRGLVSEVFWFF